MQRDEEKLSEQEGASSPVHSASPPPTKPTTPPTLFKCDYYGHLGLCRKTFTCKSDWRYHIHEVHNQHKQHHHFNNHPHDDKQHASGWTSWRSLNRLPGRLHWKVIWNFISVETTLAKLDLLRSKKLRQKCRTVCCL